MLNNPINFADPSGHMACSDDYDLCGKMVFDGKVTVSILRRALHHYGITLSDGGAENPYFKDSHKLKWDLKNAQKAYWGVSTMNGVLGGDLKTVIGSATFTLNSHPVPGKYYGETNGETIDFYVTTTMPSQNLYHEFGHVLNNLPGHDNRFSDALQNYADRSFILSGGDQKGQLDPRALYSADNYAYQHPGTDPKEQWADIFANYVAGNIKRETIPGSDMYNFITGVLPW